MAIVFVSHDPGLTIERVMEVLAAHFGNKYEVYEAGSNFIVKKSRWSAVRVKLKQWEEETALEFCGCMPSLTLNVLLILLGVGTWLLVRSVVLRATWDAMEEEVRLFIENAEEFRRVA